jgi:hypothetical protein
MRTGCVLRAEIASRVRLATEHQHQQYTMMKAVVAKSAAPAHMVPVSLLKHI